MILQTPAPPVPPAPPLVAVQDAPTPAPSLDWWQVIPAPALVLIILAGLATAAVILWPVARALARRLEGKGLTDQAARELAELREQVTELDVLRVRVHELEERVDFAERLLARPAEPAAGEPGR